MKVLWNPSETPQELHSILQTIAEEYPVESSAQNANVKFRLLPDAPDGLKVSCSGKEWLIQYGRKTLAARGVAHVLAGQSCHEEAFFTTFGILLDCTRGNVVTVARFKVWLRRLAMMGYNMAMIYVKDAYQLPGEPYFGYMRGAYSMEEIREIDAYAQKLGIEMIASIQEETVRRLYSVRLKKDEEVKRERVAKGMFENVGGDGTKPRKQPVRATKIGRNDPCPCGSGQKWKKCTCKEYHS